MGNGRQHLGFQHGVLFAVVNWRYCIMNSCTDSELDLLSQVDLLDSPADAEAAA
jgi:hypothetical protein